jgi:hypothetical protein
MYDMMEIMLNWLQDLSFRLELCGILLFNIDVMYIFWSHLQLPSCFPQERLNPDAIAYVDMNDGDQDGHIRCKNEDGAKLVTDSNLDGIQVCLLQGELISSSCVQQGAVSTWSGAVT